MSTLPAVSGLFLSLPFGRSASASGDASARTARTDSAVVPPVATLSASPGTTGAGALSAVLGSLGLSGPQGPSAAAGEADRGSMKPNLDALNRVLNHYRAQSEALATVISLSD